MPPAKTTAFRAITAGLWCNCTTDRRFRTRRRKLPSWPPQIRDANFRIETAEDGIHVYNRDGHYVAQDAFSLFPKLGVGKDAPHAFYLGAELMKAEIAWRLGKRYAQDEPLNWGCAVDRPGRGPHAPARSGTYVTRLDSAS